MAGSAPADAKTVAIAGDVFVGGQAAEEPTVASVDSNVFHSAELRVANLEHPIAAAGTPQAKSVLQARPDALARLVALRLDAVALANNHIHDLGAPAITETIEHLERTGIRSAGAGPTAESAARPARLTEQLYLLAYCQTDAPTLRQVQPATTTTPGMNPLALEYVIGDLDALPQGAKAIVYVHWGEEHLWLPSPEQIVIAREVLAHPRAALLLGSHAHRVQGFLTHAGKRAYFCLGNFLFSNFVIEPPSIAAHTYLGGEALPETRRYHPVRKPVRKKWLGINRVSIVIRYEPASGRTCHHPHAQADDRPATRELTGFARGLANAWVQFVSLPLRLPEPLYAPLYSTHRWGTRLAWRAAVLASKTRVNGVGWAVRTASKRLLRRRPC